MKLCASNLASWLLLVSISSITMETRPQTRIQIDSVLPKSGVTTSPPSRVTIHGSGFSPATVVYLDGVQARDVNYLNASTLQVELPYLRPGSYHFQLKAQEEVLRSDISFTVIPAAVDGDIDRSVALAKQGKGDTAVAVLGGIAKSDKDYQVRAFAHYQAAQIYFSEGEWWRWGAEAVSIFDDSIKSGAAVQTSWRYRLALDQAEYYLPINNESDHDQRSANWTVAKDVTGSAEPRFFRALINARYGDLPAAKSDSDFVLAQEPNNQSYRALAAYIAVLKGGRSMFESFSPEAVTDPRALSLLGEAAYLSGDPKGAWTWWKQARKFDPLSGGLACLAGKKHMARGQQRVALSLLTECIVMVPDSKDAKEAEQLLTKLRSPGP